MRITALLFTAAIALAGCARSESKPKKPNLLEYEFIRNALYAKPYETFENAAFLKPREGRADEQAFHLAPLIAFELEAGAETMPAHARFTPAHVGELGGIDGDSAGLAVYLVRSHADIHDQSWPQLSYIWFYKGVGENEPPWQWAGVRQTLDAEGFPVIMEVLFGPVEPQLIFVSKSLEERALAEFGTALPNRLFAIEPELDTTPAVIVLRALDDAPLPLGPYVYLQHTPSAGFGVTTLLCRCMASQMQNVAVNTYYDLIEVESLEQLLIAHGRTSLVCRPFSAFGGIHERPG